MATSERPAWANKIPMKGYGALRASFAGHGGARAGGVLVVAFAAWLSGCHTKTPGPASASASTSNSTSTSTTSTPPSAIGPASAPAPAPVAARVVTPTSAPAPAVAAVPVPANAAAREPVEIDLRPRLREMGLVPRAQGARGTCSIFTTCEAIEYAIVALDPHVKRLSPEYVNWAATQVTGSPSDGNFFHNALAGFDRFGLCTEELMPYERKYDAERTPSAEAKAEAARMHEQFWGQGGEAGKVVVHWIEPWTAGHSGVNDEQFAQIKEVLMRGYPVAAGSGHSRLLVGFRDDPALPGGGKFITEDSALARFSEVTYEFVRKEVADVFWVEAKGWVPTQTTSP